MCGNKLGDRRETEEPLRSGWAPETTLDQPCLLFFFFGAYYLPGTLNSIVTAVLMYYSQQCADGGQIPLLSLQHTRGMALGELLTCPHIFP